VYFLSEKWDDESALQKIYKKQKKYKKLLTKSIPRGLYFLLTIHHDCVGI